MTNQPAFAQNPDELFDVLDAHGVPTGVSRRRADIHRDGDWHRSVHIWIIGGEGRNAWIIFQQRGAHKDTHPNLLDASVAGHLGTGETMWDALREAEEEIGLKVTAEMANHIGCRLAALEKGAIRDNEIQEIIFVQATADLTDYHPNPAELEALVRIRIADLIPVLSGQESWCWGLERKANGAEGRIRIHRDHFIPTIDNYFLRIAIGAQAWLTNPENYCV
ncbi:MAG TPA: NUDIX domain-containing protein [Thermomicrobiales bacterium]|nr:NUDIX domain-containing protein [Thermomicrobiales bacterium]HRA47537.1 NUDIX domain-containing protein [Thermomicrobiales bacterium]